MHFKKLLAFQHNTEFKLGMWLGWFSRYLRVGRSGDRIPARERWSTPVQTSLGVQRVYSGHWVAFQGVMARKAWTTLHALLSDAQFKAIAALRLWDFMAYFGVTFIFHNIGAANYIRESKHNRSTKLISHLNITIFEVLTMMLIKIEAILGITLSTVDEEFSFTLTSSYTVMLCD